MNEDTILVTPYIDPDLDGVACAIAYAEYLNKTGKNAVPGIFGHTHEEAKFALNYFKIGYPEVLNNPGVFRRVIMVDNSFPHNIEKHIKPENVIEIIDHRKHTEVEAFPNAKIQIELVGSAA